MQGVFHSCECMQRPARLLRCRCNLKNINVLILFHSYLLCKYSNFDWYYAFRGPSPLQPNRKNTLFLRLGVHVFNSLTAKTPYLAYGAAISRRLEWDEYRRMNSRKARLSSIDALPLEMEGEGFGASSCPVTDTGSAHRPTSAASSGLRDWQPFFIAPPSSLQELNPGREGSPP